MTKSELIEQVVRSAGGKMSRKDADSVLDAAFATVGQALREDGRFAWAGFGTFMVRERAARRGRNPQTGNVMDIKASRTVGFKAAPGLRNGL